MPDEISGVNMQEAAAPAAEEAMPTEAESLTDEGENEQAAAEPAAEGPVQSEREGENDDPGKAEQSPEDNARFAAARRKAEREARAEVERIRAEEERRANELIAGLGFVNPETGSAVKTRAEYDAMQAAVSRQREKELAKRAGVSEEEWRAIVDASPAVQAAKEQQRRAEAEQQAARMEKIRGQLREEMAEITKLDPNLKTVEDLRADGKWSEIAGRLGRGYGLLDAYKLSHMDDLAERRAAAARQSAINSAAQKQHMQQTEQRGSGGVTVPASVRNMYRALNPKASDADIERHYKNYLKRQKNDT